jgi:hypothetical protein
MDGIGSVYAGVSRLIDNQTLVESMGKLGNDALAVLTQAAANGSPVERGQALRALDGMTGDRAATNALATGSAKAANNRPRSSVDVNSPIFIGGGGEGYTVMGQDFASSVEPYIRNRQSGNFYTHHQDSAVRSAIRATHDAGRPVILIGHSWGGADAIHAARWARSQGITVELLITIDPVGQPNYFHLSNNTYDGIARNWVTVTADRPGIQPGDVVANFWGKTPMAVQNHADIVISNTSAGHADFEIMMASANAEARIAEIYRAAR